MGMIITVTGKEGAGKSTILTNLACMLADRDTTVGILSTDLRYKSLSAYFTGIDICSENTLGRMLCASSLKDGFCEAENCMNVFIAGPGDSENSFAFFPPEDEVLEDFMEKLRALFDYALIEAGNPELNLFSAIAITNADFVLNVVEPTMQGCLYEQSCYDLIEMLSMQTPVSIGSKCKISARPQELESLCGHPIVDVLPFSVGVEESANTGVPISVDPNGPRTARRFVDKLSRIAVRIQEGEAI